jgi:hypothetical protein
MGAAPSLPHTGCNPSRFRSQVGCAPSRSKGQGRGGRPRTHLDLDMSGARLECPVHLSHPWCAPPRRHGTRTTSSIQTLHGSRTCLLLSPLQQQGRLLLVAHLSITVPGPKAQLEITITSGWLVSNSTSIFTMSSSTISSISSSSAKSSLSSISAAVRVLLAFRLSANACICCFVTFSSAARVSAFTSPHIRKQSRNAESVSVRSPTRRAVPR